MKRQGEQVRGCKVIRAALSIPPSLFIFAIVVCVAVAFVAVVDVDVVCVAVAVVDVVCVAVNVFFVFVALVV